MAVRVLLDNKAFNFCTNKSYHDNIFSSNDGMRPGGRSYLAEECNAYSFSKEEKTDDGFWYDLEVRREVNSFRLSKYNLTSRENVFKEYFSDISRDLRRRGYRILNYTSVVWMIARHLHFDRETKEDVIEVRLMTDENILDEKRASRGVNTLPEILAYLREEDESANMASFLRTVGDFGYIQNQYIKTESIPKDLFGKTFELTVKRRDLSPLFEKAQFRREVTEYFEKRIEEYRNYHYRYYSIHSFLYVNIDDIEEFVMSLPDDFRRKVIGISKQTPKNLLLRRQYDGASVDWHQINPDEIVDSDLDLLIKCQVHLDSGLLGYLMSGLMGTPEREKKVVQNAWTVAYSHQELIAERLKSCSHSEHLRGLIADLNSRGQVEMLHSISSVFHYGYSDLNPSDVKALSKCFIVDDYRSFFFLVRIALISGVSEGELVSLILKIEKDGILSRDNEDLNRLYAKYDFAPGLRWMEEKVAREEANRQEEMKARIAENQKAVDYVKSSGKLSVRVKTIYNDVDEDYRFVKTVDGHSIGLIFASEQRILRMAGRQFDYLINVERAQRLRNGVLHLDILEVDAGAIIGRGGSNLKEAVETLNRLGCSLRTIKVHRHSEEEGVV